MFKNLIQLRKTATIFTIFALALIVVACAEDETEVVFELPDGEIYETRTVDEDGYLASYPTPDLEDAYFLGWYTDEDFEELFRIEDAITEDKTVYAETTAYDGETLKTPLTDRLEMPDYEGKTFHEDGIGEAELNQCIDGDTTWFTASGQFANVRYLNIDTPESTGEIEPWGKASSDFVCEALEEADTIVLEYEPHPDQGHPEEHPSVGRTGTYGRDLAYVWYDGRLLNLEVVELGFSPASNPGQSQYGEYLTMAHHNAAMTGRHIHGEEDPDFNIDDPEDVTIADLNENTDDYIDQFVNVEGVIYQRDDDGVYICDGEETIYVYTMGDPSSKLQTGHEVRMEELFLTYWRGSLQLTNFDSDLTDVLDTDADTDCIE